MVTISQYKHLSVKQLHDDEFHLFNESDLFPILYATVRLAIYFFSVKLLHGVICSMD